MKFSIKRLFVVVMYLLVSAFSARAAFADAPIVMIEQPANSEVVSGVISIFGWAVGNPEVESVSYKIDDKSAKSMPYGGSRNDVAAAYPDYPDANESGYSMVFNTRRLDNGPHTLSISATNKTGDTTTETIEFVVSNAPGDDNPYGVVIDLSNATVSIVDSETLFLENVIVDGKSVNTLLAYSPANNAFWMTSFQDDSNGDGKFEDDENGDGYHDDDENKDGKHDYVKVLGEVTAINGDMVSVRIIKHRYFDPQGDSLDIDITGAKFEGGAREDLAVGSIIEVKGEWNAPILTAVEVEFEDDESSDLNAKAKLEGEIVAVDGNVLTVAVHEHKNFPYDSGDVLVDISAAEYKQGASVSDMVVGTVIEVRGKWDAAAGMLLAKHIEVDGKEDEKEDENEDEKEDDHEDGHP